MVKRRKKHEKGGEGALSPSQQHTSVLQEEVPGKAFPASLTH